MFIESISAQREEWARWTERFGLLTDPPEALVAAIVFDSGDAVTGVHVWDSAEAMADFFIERIKPIVEVEGMPPMKPQRHGEPLAFYVRPGATIPG